jgi:hypothetical protein
MTPMSLYLNLAPSQTITPWCPERLTSDGYTRESLFPDDEYSRESRLPVMNTVHPEVLIP